MFHGFGFLIDLVYNLYTVVYKLFLLWYHIASKYCKINKYCDFIVVQYAKMYCTSCIRKIIKPGMTGSLRCRAEGCVSREGVGLPAYFSYAGNSEEPQSSQLSQQRLR